MTTTEIAVFVFGILIGAFLLAIVWAEVCACCRSSQISRMLEDPPVEGEE